MLWSGCALMHILLLFIYLLFYCCCCCRCFWRREKVAIKVSNRAMALNHKSYPSRAVPIVRCQPPKWKFSNLRIQFCVCVCVWGGARAAHPSRSLLVFLVYDRARATHREKTEHTAHNAIRPKPYLMLTYYIIIIVIRYRGHDSSPHGCGPDVCCASFAQP